jgi:hypothetical protein
MLPKMIVAPPFSLLEFTLEAKDMMTAILGNPHPTDLLVDASVFSLTREHLIRDLLLHCLPILLPPVLEELEDVKTKPSLKVLRDYIFPGGALNSRFRTDPYEVLMRYPRVVVRNASLLRWRREAIEAYPKNHSRDRQSPGRKRKVQTSPATPGARDIRRDCKASQQAI